MNLIKKLFSVSRKLYCHCGWTNICLKNWVLLHQKQEHRTFIDWFIAVPAKITSSGHQIELKMYEQHFYKVEWEELDRLIEAA